MTALFIDQRTFCGDWFFPCPMYTLRLNPGHLSWWEDPSPTEPSLWPNSLVLKLTTYLYKNYSLCNLTNTRS